MSHVVGKPNFGLCENKSADQLRSNCEADQHLCFRYSDSTISLLPKSKISSFKPSSVLVQLGLCQSWTDTLKTSFLTSWLIFTSTPFSKCLNSGQNWILAYAKTKVQTSVAVTAKLVCTFVFAVRIVQFLFFLNPKFPANLASFSRLIFTSTPFNKCLNSGQMKALPA